MINNYQSSFVLLKESSDPFSRNPFPEAFPTWQCPVIPFREPFPGTFSGNPFSNMAVPSDPFFQKPFPGTFSGTLFLIDNYVSRMGNHAEGRMGGRPKWVEYINFNYILWRWGSGNDQDWLNKVYRSLDMNFISIKTTWNGKLVICTKYLLKTYTILKPRNQNRKPRNLFCIFK